MPRRASKRQEVDDFIATAREAVERTIGEPIIPHKKNPHAVALSKLGASKGGKARAAQLTPEERRAIALRAARARWGKHNSQ
jgi:hypothetical protein